MSEERGHEDGRGDTGSATRDAGGALDADATARPGEGRWRRVLLLIWGGVMIAVILTGVVGFLAYFFLLQR